MIPVAYDTFTGPTANGGNAYEVMVWLGVYGGVSPLSANGYPFKPIASPVIGGTQFDLAYGLNEAGVKGLQLRRSWRCCYQLFRRLGMLSSRYPLVARFERTVLTVE